MLTPEPDTLPLTSTVTGQVDMSSPPVQLPAQHRPAPTACIVGLERGLRCLPVVPGSLYCDNHSPDRRERRREITRLAARASHAHRPDPALEAWADTFAWEDEAGVRQSLREAAALVAKGDLSPAQGNTIAALAREWRARPAKPAQGKGPLVVEVQRYGTNGQGPAREAAE